MIIMISSTKWHNSRIPTTLIHYKRTSISRECDFQTSIYCKCTESGEKIIWFQSCRRWVLGRSAPKRARWKGKLSDSGKITAIDNSISISFNADQFHDECSCAQGLSSPKLARWKWKLSISGKIATIDESISGSFDDGQYFNECSCD